MDFFDTPASQQWMQFLGATPDTAVFFSTPEGVIRGWAGASSRVTGYSADEAIGQSLSMLFTPEDRERGLDVHEIALVNARGVAECDRWNLRKDGSRFWASGVLTAIRDDSQKVVALCKVMRDKTDVRYQVEGLQHQLLAREAALKRQDAFIATTAHELRNPLMPVFSAIAILKLPVAREMVSKAVKTLENQAAVLKTLVDDMSEMIWGGEAPELVLQRIDLNHEVTTAVDGLLEAARSRGHEVALVLPPAPIAVQADPVRLAQILLNLLNNALKYTPDGGHIGVSVSVEAELAVVRIEDDGIGISAEVLPHIFELFTRERRGPGIEGAGVGLAVVKELARMHGGHIDARSPGPGQGSVFSLRLPVCAGDAPDAAPGG